MKKVAFICVHNSCRSQIVGFLVTLGIFVGSFLLLKEALATGAMDSKVPVIPLPLGYFAPVLGFGMALVRYALCVIKGGKEA